MSKNPIKSVVILFLAGLVLTTNSSAWAVMRPDESFSDCYQILERPTTGESFLDQFRSSPEPLSATSIDTRQNMIDILTSEQQSLLVSLQEIALGRDRVAQLDSGRHGGQIEAWLENYDRHERRIRGRLLNIDIQLRVLGISLPDQKKGVN